MIPVSVKKHSSGEKHIREDKLAEHQIRGWRAASDADLRGKGSRKRSFFYRDTGNILGFRGSGSGKVLIFRGGVLMSVGNLPEILSQAILAGIILAR